MLTYYPNGRSHAPLDLTALNAPRYTVRPGPWSQMRHDTRAATKGLRCCENVLTPPTFPDSLDAPHTPTCVRAAAAAAQPFPYNPDVWGFDLMRRHAQLVQRIGRAVDELLRAYP